MPIHPVMRNNRIYGYQWGNTGKVYPIAIYTLEGAMKKAQVQGRAAYAGGYESEAKKTKKGRTMVKKHKRKGKTIVKKHWRTLN